MAWRIPDLPHSNASMWITSCIFLFPVVYTFILPRLAPTPPSTPQLMATEIHRRRAQYLEATQRELEIRKQQIVDSPFPFLNLPPEVCVLVLAHCSEWPETFRSLALVSQGMRCLSYDACLPHMPILLINESQIVSFGLLLQREPRVSCLIHHIWVTPAKEDLLDPAARIVRVCANVQTLALDAAMLQDAVMSSFDGHQTHHSQCRQVTLLNSRHEDWVNTLSSSSGQSFLHQLTHLRLVGDRVPPQVVFPRLTHLSCALNQAVPHVLVEEEMLQDKETYPSLRSIILTRERTSAGGLRISKMKKAKIFTFEVPRQRTEVEIWCENALGKGMWEMCADPKVP